MVSEAKGRLFRRKDGKYLIYVPAEDTMFPFKGVESLDVRISFQIDEDKLIVERWEEKEKEKAIYLE